MRRYLRLSWAFLRQHVKVMLEYRLNALISAAGSIAWQAATLAGIWAVMGLVENLNGWHADEVYLVYGLFTLAAGVSKTLTQNLFYLGQGYVRPGRLDALLTRPMNPLFHLLADRFSYEGIGDALTGIVLLLHSWRALSIAVTPDRLLVLLTAVLFGAVVVTALYLLAASSAFWITIATPVNLAFGHMSQFALYPLTIYGKAVQILFTWVIPYGMVSFYPAQYLLGRGTAWMVLAMAPVSALLMALAYRVWLVGLGRYSSTGS
jgi:ABC-2 type transport system permease protein